MSGEARGKRPRAYAVALVLAFFGPLVVCVSWLAALRFERLLRRRLFAGCVIVASVPLALVLAASYDPGVALSIKGGFAPDITWHVPWRWWVEALPLSPALGLGLYLARPPWLGLGESSSFSGQPPDLALGRHLAGDRVLEVQDGWALMSLERLKRHALVLGSSGSGKTETLLRLAYAVARSCGWRIFFVDAKGEHETMQRFYALMQATGRATHLFPQEGYDGWRGPAIEISNRLLQLVDFAHEGPAAYYRDIAVAVIRLACQAPSGPPRSSRELLERLNLRTLRTLYARDHELGTVEAFSERQINEVRARYQSFFGSLGTSLDAGWAFEDAGAGYLLLDGLRLKHEATKLARFFTEDFIQFVTARKSSQDRVLFVVDEFSQIAQSANLLDVVERTRSFGVAAVVAPQVIEGMGRRSDAARMMGSTHTTFLHAVPNPEEAVRIAGSRVALDPSIDLRVDSTHLGTARVRHYPRVDPDDVRRLAVGTCYVMGSGYAGKIAVSKAPNLRKPPPPEARSVGQPQQPKKTPIKP